MKKIYIIIIFVLAIPVIGQYDNMCHLFDPPDSVTASTFPWYGNNEYLDSLADVMGYNDSIPQHSIAQSNAEGGFDGVAEVWIPVKAWIHHDNNGNGGISEAEVEQSIRELNNRFNAEYSPDNQAWGHTRIQLYDICQT